ncbi:MAG: four helix bundle protein [Anaerolineales bacterium]|nr:four helix bundle protein [Anaerolineales bacterium]
MGGRLPYAQRFDDLVVYQKARALAAEIFSLTKAFPREEAYSLIDQVRRSSRSVGAQIAEAWAKRRYERHFVSKLTDADGEQYETQHWISVATDCGYLNTSQSADLIARCQEIGRLLGTMITKAHLFCDAPLGSVREAAGEYFVEVNGEQ